VKDVVNEEGEETRGSWTRHAALEGSSEGGAPALGMGTLEEVVLVVFGGAERTRGCVLEAHLLLGCFGGEMA